ncbi:6,7-dimethyl-8-ribityllumazine synthase [Solimonas terrae]|uniref:6,7-dimethyl-8-ribityllumazine synthase n=1 Tax=Solimonas terrae TaxID=1396819 RepID=A0A6M2BN72_9GAMM|nr:6,7-dimethyl-8-ribityllumazine synthase [Solimonas terrae]NGY03483.1 6,7-dimethyl-8-ribityllumazine synthase [Solimonas terrae]
MSKTRTAGKAKTGAPADAKTGYAAPGKPAAGEFAKAKIAIVATRWNVEIVDALVAGARACLKDWGVADKRVSFHRAPGAYEIPLAAKLLLDSGFDGVVTLGAVIRGDTPHFDFVAGECARGLIDVQLQTGKPVGFGVLTVNTVKQAVERAGPGSSNKGYEAAAAMLEMLRLGKELK